MDNQSERKRSVERKIQRKKSYAEILKTDRIKAGKLEQNRSEGAVDIVANKGFVVVDFKVNETHVTNNCVHRRRLKIAKPKIVDSCELKLKLCAIIKEVISKRLLLLQNL